MEVTCLFISWDVHGDVGHELLGVFGSLAKAQNALRKQAEIEQTQSWISSFVNDVGLTLEESDMSFVADYNEYEYHTEMWLETHAVE